MTDVHDRATAVMARVKSQNTGPERLLRKTLTALGALLAQSLVQTLDQAAARTPPARTWVSAV